MLAVALGAAEHLQGVLGTLRAAGYISLPAQIQSIRKRTGAGTRENSAQCHATAALRDRLGELNDTLLHWLQAHLTSKDISGPINIPFIGPAGAGKSSTICALLDDDGRLVVWQGSTRGTEASNVIVDEKYNPEQPGEPHSYTVTRYSEAWWRRLLDPELYKLTFKKVQGAPLLVSVEALVDDWTVRQVTQCLQALLPDTPDDIPCTITDNTKSHSWKTQGAMTRTTQKTRLKMDVDSCGGYHAACVRHVRRRSEKQKAWVGFQLLQLEDCPGFEATGSRQWSLHSTRLSLSQPDSTVAVLVVAPERLMGSGLETVLDLVLEAMRANPELHLVVLVRTYAFMCERPQQPAQEDKQLTDLHTTLVGDGHAFSKEDEELWDKHTAARRLPKRSSDMKERRGEALQETRELCRAMLWNAAATYFGQRIKALCAQSVNCSDVEEFEASHADLSDRISVSYFVKWDHGQLQAVRLLLLNRAMHGFLRRMVMLTDTQIIADALDAMEAKREYVDRLNAKTDPTQTPAFKTVHVALQPLVQVLDGVPARQGAPHRALRSDVVHALQGLSEWARDYKALYRELTDVQHVKELLVARYRHRSKFTGLGCAVREFVCPHGVSKLPDLVHAAASLWVNKLFGATPKGFTDAARPLWRAVYDLSLECGSGLENSHRHMLRDAAGHYLRRQLMVQPLAPLDRYQRTLQQAPICSQVLAACRRYRGRVQQGLPDNFHDAEEFAEAFAPHLAAVYRIMGERHGPEEPGFLASVDQVVANVREAVRSLPAVLAGDVQYQVEFQDRGAREHEEEQLQELTTESAKLANLIVKLHSALGTAALQLRAMAKTHRSLVRAGQAGDAERQQCSQYAKMFAMAAKLMKERQEQLRPVRQRKRPHSALDAAPSHTATATSAVGQARAEVYVKQEPSEGDGGGDHVVGVVRGLMPRPMLQGPMRVTPSRVTLRKSPAAVHAASAELTTDSEDDEE